jgi:hypothetical protein
MGKCNTTVAGENLTIRTLERLRIRVRILPPQPAFPPIVFLSEGRFVSGANKNLSLAHPRARCANKGKERVFPEEHVRRSPKSERQFECPADGA